MAESRRGIPCTADKKTCQVHTDQTGIISAQRAAQFGELHRHQ